MNKKKVTAMIIVLSFLLILFVPIPAGVHKDGGTRTYTALTYKAVKWNRIIDENCKYTKISVYLLPNNFKSIDELWNIEQENCTADDI